MEAVAAIRSGAAELYLDDAIPISTIRESPSTLGFRLSLYAFVVDGRRTQAQKVEQREAVEAISL